MNNLKDAYIRVSVSRGEEGFGIDASDLAAPTVSIVTRRLMPYPAWMYEKGIRVMAVSLRLNERSPVSRVKSFNFLNNILARFEAKGRGFDEAILMNTRGCIAEAATSNVFLVRKGMIATPSLETGMLPGVTRRVVLKIARDLRLRPVEKAISYSELVRAGEVFLTNSLFEIMPVIKIDTHTINDGRVGATTRLLGACYRKLTCERAAARGA
jgi:branched-subunit amino acid aminotransferase/4-amino-4-deoxychorismate lyase